MNPLDHPTYRLELVGGPRDGHVEIVKLVDATLEYYTSPGRVAVYREASRGRYVFEGYRKVLAIDAPMQRIQFYPDFDTLGERDG